VVAVPRLVIEEGFPGTLSRRGITGESFLIVAGEPISPFGVFERAAILLRSLRMGCLGEEIFFGCLDVLLVLHDLLNIAVDLAHEGLLCLNALFVG
jgi:hypothetical protein